MNKKKKKTEKKKKNFASAAHFFVHFFGFLRLPSYTFYRGKCVVSTKVLLVFLFTFCFTVAHVDNNSVIAVAFWWINNGLCLLA